MRWRRLTILGRFGIALAVCGCLHGCDGYMSSDDETSDQAPADSPPDPGDELDDGPVELPSGQVCSRISPGEAALPRLTQREYNNTIDDLFPDVDIDHLSVPGDQSVGPFPANTSLAVGDLIAEQYQKNAETVSQAVTSHLDELVPCASSSSAELYHGEAEAIGGSAGEADGDYWDLYTLGSIQTNISVDAAGRYAIAIKAFGTRGGDELPKMTVNVNGKQIEAFDIDAQRADPSVYRVSQSLDAGTHTIAVAFTNDFSDESTGADRNLFVDSITVTQTDRVEIDDQCAQNFINQTGRQAYRRPLTDREESRLWTLFASNRSDFGSTTALRAVIEGLLQSPKFLYRFNRGDAADGDFVELSDYEVASRLSYFLWNSMPDDKLLDAAAAGELSTPEGIERQTRRILDTPRAHQAVNRAFMAWMGLDDFDSIQRNDPDFSDEMRHSMEATTLAFIDQVIWQGDGRLSTLLTAPFAYVDRQTAPLYGVDPPAGDEMVRVSLDGDRRRGILTQPAVLTRHSYGDQTVHRGLFVRQALLCSSPPPPPNTFDDPPETYEGEPLRERSEDRMAHHQCGVCHSAMDPLGLTFNQFDSLGRWQQQDEYGNELTSTGAVDQNPVDGAVELAESLAGSEQVRQCIVRQWFRLAFARRMTGHDSCSLKALETALSDSNGDIPELLVAMTQSNAFRYRLADDSM